MPDGETNGSDFSSFSHLVAFQLSSSSRVLKVDQGGPQVDLWHSQLSASVQLTFHHRSQCRKVSHLKTPELNEQQFQKLMTLVGGLC